MKPRLPIALASLWACVVSTALYAMLRALQYVFFPDANPATVVWSAHAGYFWRMLIVAYAGGMTLFTVLAIARRNPERVANALLPALSVAATLLAAQALFLP